MFRLTSTHAIAVEGRPEAPPSDRMSATANDAETSRQAAVAKATNLSCFLVCCARAMTENWFNVPGGQSSHWLAGEVRSLMALDCINKGVEFRFNYCGGGRFQIPDVEPGPSINQRSF